MCTPAGKSLMCWIIRNSRLHRKQILYDGYMQLQQSFPNSLNKEKPEEASLVNVLLLASLSAVVANVTQYLCTFFHS